MYNQEMKERKSVRTYKKQPLTHEHRSKIETYLQSMQNFKAPFDSTIESEIIYTNGSGSGKIGTYGTIKNSQAFIVMKSPNNFKAILDCGYVFEKLVLYLQSLGIGTCWVAGTFNRKQLKVQHLAVDQFIPAVLTIGYKAEKESLYEKAAKKMNKARKEFDTLFFQDTFSKKVENQQTRDLFEYVRLAPSALNKQPWRLVQEGNTTHFYMEKSSLKSESKLNYDVQLLDMGIALCHFDLATPEMTYTINEPTSITTPNVETLYIASATLK